MNEWLFVMSLGVFMQWYKAHLLRVQTVVAIKTEPDYQEIAIYRQSHIISMKYAGVNY